MFCHWVMHDVDVDDDGGDDDVKERRRWLR